MAREPHRDRSAPLSASTSRSSEKPVHPDQKRKRGSERRPCTWWTPWTGSKGRGAGIELGDAASDLSGPKGKPERGTLEGKGCERQSRSAVGISAVGRRTVPPVQRILGGSTTKWTHTRQTISQSRTTSWGSSKAIGGR